MNENIIEAAEAARSQILGGPWNGEYDANFILGFEVGAAWERDREPSEAEVEEAAIELGALQVLMDGRLPVAMLDEVRQVVRAKMADAPEASEEGRESTDAEVEAAMHFLAHFRYAPWWGGSEFRGEAHALLSDLRAARGQG